jgi:hypothetical protein
MIEPANPASNSGVVAACALRSCNGLPLHGAPRVIHPSQIESPESRNRIVERTF